MAAPMPIRRWFVPPAKCAMITIVARVPRVAYATNGRRERRSRFRHKENDVMLIAQISDIHIGFDSATAEDANLRRLDAALRRIEAMPVLPDRLLVSGDLTEHGDEASYRLLGERLARCPVPSHLMLGNHDARAGFRKAFPDAADADGFLQYVVEDPSLRMIILDTLEEGRHGGAFCETRAAWLAARLDEAPDQPPVIALHHPPFDSGIEWMTPDPAEPWVARLRLALA